MTKSERTATLLDLRDGGVELSDIKQTCLVYTSIGRAMSLAKILKNRIPWSFGPSDDQKADRLMQRDQAIIFDKRILSELRYQGEEKVFFTWLVENGLGYGKERQLQNWQKLERLYKPYADLTDNMNDAFIRLPDNKLKIRERYILRTLENFDCWDGRVICIGLSDTADAWTDGCSYICMDRNWLDKLYLPGDTGVAKLINILVHELAHDEDTSGTHLHGEEFYRRFHDLCCRHDSPRQRVIARFYKLLQDSRLMARQEVIDKKEVKAQKKIDNVLGVAASE